MARLSKQKEKGKKRRVGGAGCKRSASPRKALHYLDTCCRCLCLYLYLYLQLLLLIFLLLLLLLLVSSCSLLTFCVLFSSSCWYCSCKAADIKLVGLSIHLCGVVRNCDDSNAASCTTDDGDACAITRTARRQSLLVWYYCRSLCGLFSLSSVKKSAQYSCCATNGCELHSVHLEEKTGRMQGRDQVTHMMW